jgi:DNA repair photolyase
MIPMLNDATLEEALEAGHAAGAREAGYVLLRLSHELRDLFKDWLAVHHPERAAHVMSIVRQSRGGRENDTTFGVRMRGQGVFADMIAQRFKKACARLGLNARHYALDTLRFRRSEILNGTTPDNGSRSGPQLSLF